MTVQYIKSDNTVETVGSVTSVKPAKNGTKLVLYGTTIILINVMDLLSIDN